MFQGELRESHIIRMPDVLAVTGLSRSTIWRLSRSGQFPSPIRLSARAVGWRSSDVQAWITHREKVSVGRNNTQSAQERHGR